MFSKEEKEKWIQEKIKIVKDDIAYIEFKYRHNYVDEFMKERIKGLEIQIEILEEYLEAREFLKAYEE